MKKFPRFTRVMGRLLNDFPMLEKGDSYLVPIDNDYQHLSLVAWLQLKNSAMNDSKEMKVVHFYFGDKPNENTIEALTKFCERRKLSLSTRKVGSESLSRMQLKEILLDAAIEFNCNKIVLPDSLDYIDSTVLSNMAFAGTFTGPLVIEDCQQDDHEIKFIRPFCNFTDEEIEKVGMKNKFDNEPTGVKVVDDEKLNITKRALSHFLDGSSNIMMNFFNAQYNIQKKYIGEGNNNDEPLQFTDDLEF